MNDSGTDALIDVGELSIDELSAAVDEKDLGLALDRILHVSDNSAGFNNHI
jgi:hypothetical protein